MMPLMKLDTHGNRQRSGHHNPVRDASENPDENPQAEREHGTLAPDHVG
jgi:hypothetical protein